MNSILKMALRWLVTNGLPYIVAWLESLIDVYFPVNTNWSDNHMAKYELRFWLDKWLSKVQDPPQKLARFTALNAMTLKKYRK